MDFKTEIEKITGMALLGTGKYDEDGNYNWNKLEKANGIGFDVKTSTGKVVHETQRKAHLRIKIVNKNTITVATSKAMKCMDVIAIYKDKEQKKKYFKGSLDIWYDGKDFYEEQPEGEYYTIETNMIEKEDIKRYYEKTMDDFKELDELTGLNATDVNNYGLHYGRQLAYMRFKYLFGSEEVCEDEHQMLEGVVRGGHNWKSEETFEDAFQYDMNNMYAYCMNHKDFKFPISCGEFVTLTQKQSINENFGMFKLELTKYDKRLFRENKSGFYTSYDVKTLDLIGAKYELVNCKKNAYVYENDVLVKGAPFFGYMKDLYKLKLNGNNVVKQINSQTWGLLSEERKWKRHDIENLTESEKEKVVFIDVLRGYAELKHDKPYRFRVSRIKPFILAFAKSIFIGNVVKNSLKHNIYKIKTDAVITCASPEEMGKIWDVSSEIGCLKVEKEYKGKWRIKNMNAVEKVV